MANPQHIKWLLEGVEAWNARREPGFFRKEFYRPDLVNADLERAQLREVNLRNANLQGAKLGWASLPKADLRNAVLRRANLQGAHLHGADLRDADLRNANLQGAVLRGAELWEGKLEGANLQGADLLGAVLLGANLRGTDLRAAKLEGADLAGMDLSDAKVSTLIYYVAGSNDEDFREYTDLSKMRSLTQDQLETMRGDSGTILPEGLTHPAHWPDLDPDEPVSVPDEEPEAPTPAEPDLTSVQTRPFVFLSYARPDADFAETFRDFLRGQGLDVWWDDDIAVGTSWPDAIKDALTQSSAVVTLWTTASAASPNVTEEARIAQKAGKLLPAIRETAELPYGFGETQWAKLQDWDGTATHREMQKLLQALRDKLFPPANHEIDTRHAQASPTGFVVEQGQLAPRDTPPNIDPKITDEVARDNRLEAVFRQVDLLATIVEKAQVNVGRSFDARVDAFLKLQDNDRVLWDVLNTETAAIIGCCLIPETGEVLSDEIAPDVSALRGKIAACRDYIEPLQAPEGTPDAKPVTTSPNLAGHEEDTQVVADDLAAMIAAQEAVTVLNPAALDVFDRILTDLRHSIEERDPAATRHSIARAGQITARLHADLQNGTFRALLGTEASDAADILEQRVNRLLDVLRAFFR